jgi:hypothetical protein
MFNSLISRYGFPSAYGVLSPLILLSFFTDFNASILWGNNTLSGVAGEAINRKASRYGHHRDFFNYVCI